MPDKKPGPKPKTLDLAKLEQAAAMGGTNDLIAAAMGISTRTLSNYRKKSAAVDEAIRRGKDRADVQIVSTLFRKATGNFPCPHCGKQVPGPAADTTAMIFWLKNRRPLEWRDRRDVGLEALPGTDGEDRELIIKVVKTKDA